MEPDRAREGRQRLFRGEALVHHAHRHYDGSLLRMAPSWTRWTFALVVLVFVAGALYAALGRVDEYASGPAIVRVDGRIDLTAKLAGTVAAIEVQPGQRVAAGQPLVQFFDEDESGELDRLREEFDLQLIKLLRDPADAGARQALTSLRAQRELAATRVAQRLLRAPRPGVVSDVRIRPGQRLAPGELVLSLVPDGARLSLVALLPGNDRPLLRPGMALGFELVGYDREHHELTIDSVSDEVVGPSEAKRFLGPDIADSMSVDGPVVLVRARLEARHFLSDSSDGRPLSYYDGLQARAQAAIRSERIAGMLLPALKVLWTHGR
ncbi:MAG TPA: HlyD family efflux transporter periplasmic adaptor subunit [Polyangia bacterium]|jgi:membrane fusion protein (multidrug efflux system)